MLKLQDESSAANQVRQKISMVRIFLENPFNINKNSNIMLYSPQREIKVVVRPHTLEHNQNLICILIIEGHHTVTHTLDTDYQLTG